MVDASVSFAIERLGDFLIQQVNIRIGVQDGVRWLKDELAYLQSSVRAAESRQEEELILIWINNVKDVANDAVTLLDRFSSLQEEHAGREQGLLDRLQSCICICKKEASIYDIGNNIESLKGRVDEIKKKREEYGISNILATPVVQKRKRTLLRTTSFENLVDVVGFEDDAKTLLAELVSKDPSLNVISIHGMGGLGKTTLASKLYHSKELSHFRRRAWVCVSQDYDIRDVLNKIIKSFEGHEVDLSKMDEGDLLRHLRNLLQDHDRYLAVIDDIWDTEAWEKIKKAFPDKKNGSRVIITTRIKRVAERVDDRGFVHELRFLREDESWQLFCKRAKPTLNLEKLGKEMVGKCRGLPLAIMVLSGLLLHKKSYEDWSKMKDHIWRELKEDSLEIQEILSLSYDDLSFKMRQCFLYLARFPEDYSFGVDELKLLWIAEEFITEADERDGLVMEDVAEDYLNELINRNIIQITYLFLNGHVFECRVHDLVRDLAIRKATEHKLLGIFDSSRQHTSPIHLLHGQPRHAIYNGIGEYMNLLGPGSDDLKLRSLALIHEFESLKLEEIKLMYTRFKYLKVLNLRSVISVGIPEEIGDLVLLKFLSLMGGDSACDLLVIPPTIGKLKKLQTLCGLISCKYEFPREICELKELRHLNFYEIIGGSLNIGSHQTKLQTLGRLRYEDWIQIDTLKVTNIHALDIIVSYSITGTGFTLDSVANLTSLESFSLEMSVIPTIEPLSSCKRLKRVILNGRMNNPSELSFLPNSVTDLALIFSMFTEDPMPTLGGLSNLIALSFSFAYLGEKMVCSDDAFPSLQFLKIDYLLNVEEWQIEDGAMPCLKGFEIRLSNCEKLKMVPSRVSGVPPVPDIFYDYYCRPMHGTR